ncbi:hypothetical protein JY481_10710 [Serratia marcescens]|uniref:hypothetical protein n=1 Tax=Serratia TaxID=613 RepID=UPI0012AEBE41|nr:hypothetical protein [Serratia marcescens]MBN5334930.1 hypothetical protein [Serratia marcescens]MBN5340757.1 hypothetical protein [Serratia marcescens]HEJ7190147.1 hypothetical protein [Serratia marcescens]HEJ7830123.1 hypothetical protein [Serratia marcescens]HEJ8124143.1 hypothetical protein [Serratia marcescens]
MTESTIVKIRYTLNGEKIEVDFDSDGYDQVNAVLEYIADKHVPAQVVDSKPKEVTRPVLYKRNLHEYGISDVYVKFEGSDWLPLDDRDLVCV